MLFTCATSYGTPYSTSYGTCYLIVLQFELGGSGKGRSEYSSSNSRSSRLAGKRSALDEASGLIR